ncbi:MAG: hypothetical protein KY469_12430 [Actinobacteria bacterium]|nr:hypothetical protein [Actinomycetota bacterium]
MTAQRGGIVGGAAVPHAPQFFTLPDTEDHDQVARVEEVMGRIGAGLRDLAPDVVVIVANDHLENFALSAVPSFTVHVGPQVTGSFAGRDFAWPVASDLGAAVVRELQDQRFDPAFTLNASIGYEFGIPLTFCGFDADTLLLPVYVNTYVAPQPRAERCYAFGQALHRALLATATTGVIIASGGLSHFPGTPRYSQPDVDTDRSLFDQLAAGNLRQLLAFDQERMDHTGNVEVRSWQILAGALGERRPDLTAFEPSWHHTYAVLGWTSPDEQPPTDLHYPPIRADLLPLTEALYGLRMRADVRAAFLEDADGYADGFDLPAPQRDALVALDEDTLREIGVHPLLAFLARLQVDLERRHAQS